MFKLLLTASVVICDLYLFYIISLLNPDFKLVNNLISSSLDKVTAGTYNLQSFIASVAPVGALSLLPPPMSLCSKLVTTQFLFHFNSKDTSQLINGIFSALQKLPKYFNGKLILLLAYHFYLHHSQHRLHLNYIYCQLFYFYN